VCVDTRSVTVSLSETHHDAVLCCAVLCCAVLCYAVLCCVVVKQQVDSNTSTSDVEQSTILADEPDDVDASGIPRRLRLAETSMLPLIELNS
jgi:hypothetical protein